LFTSIRPIRTFDDQKSVTRPASQHYRLFMFRPVRGEVSSGVLQEAETLRRHDGEVPMAFTRKTLVVAGLAALVAGGGVAVAQGRHGDGMGMGHGMGPGMMGGGRMGERFCAAKDPMAPAMATRIETRLKPTDAQRADFEALKAAMVRAEQTLKAACPTEAERGDRTPPARLAMAEKRMAAGLEALRTVRAPFDTLYAKLDDKQRDQLRWSGHGGRWGGWGPGR
jgi:hypothetical protein